MPDTDAVLLLPFSVQQGMQLCPWGHLAALCAKEDWVCLTYVQRTPRDLQESVFPVTHSHIPHAGKHLHSFSFTLVQRTELRCSARSRNSRPYIFITCSELAFVRLGTLFVLFAQHCHTLVWWTEKFHACLLTLTNWLSTL